MYQNQQTANKKPVLVGAAAVALLVGAATYSMKATEAPAAVNLLEGFNDADLEELATDAFSDASVTRNAMGTVTGSSRFQLKVGGAMSFTAEANVNVEARTQINTQACGQCQDGGYDPAGMDAETFTKTHAAMMDSV